MRDPHERAPGPALGGRTGPRQLKAPIPGRGASVAVRAGEEVHVGQALASPGVTVEGGWTLVAVAQ